MPKTYEIVHDEDCSDPRENDNAAVLLFFHKRYRLGDSREVCEAAGMNYRTDDFSGWDELEEQIEKDFPEALIIDVYMYDHSGLTLSTTPFSCPWDSGKIGFAVVTAETIRKEWDGDRARARKCVETEIEEYSKWLEGDTWGFIIRDSKGKQIDSCWGFIDSEYAKEEAKAAAGRGAKEIEVR